ncbi:MAG: three-Cys-motif partner protein TcmP [Bacteroidota bacterium]
MGNKIDNSLNIDHSGICSSDDGLIIPEVGSWAERKYKLVHLYCDLFLKGIRHSWNQLVYIDLFAGSGKAKVRNTDKILAGSPLLALGLANKFDQYIFCEENEGLLQALQTRVESEYPQVNAHYILGDCNKKITDVLKLIPTPSRNNKVLTFCFVDPFSLNIEFDTIRTLCAQRYVDFLILLALSMDGVRNESIYIENNNQRIDKFLGLSEWRGRWKNEQIKGKSFRKFLANEYAQQMVTLNYKEESIKQMLEIKSDEKNLSLYHLAFFSRHSLGYRYWKEVKKYASDQRPLFED